MPGGPRAELYAALDGYLAGLRERDPERCRWGAKVRNSENNVLLEPGDGLWGTVTGLGSYDLRFADVERGQVGFFGSVIETRDESPCTVRLRIASGRVAEVETLIVRAADSGLKFPAAAFEHKPVLNERVDPGERASRARMIALADGYFDTLELNDGTILTRIHPQCERVENGVRTTHNPALTLTSVAALGCEEQLRLGYYRYDDRLRGRRYELIDEERGLVLACAFIDHSGRLGRYQLTDGREVESPVRRPHSFYVMELFKIKCDAIEQIEANFITVPYHMPSPWDERAHARRGP
ncbi:MAG TPA: hypothetical protein VMD49_07735 [Steroidobacteraceae bacterium]|nr:hypothetical protein [Steroidobacteraceae bacterium]